jgi:ubiquinone/menaquinone biosynthesis C-methylase UbiE
MRIQDAYAHWAQTYDSDVNLTRDLDYFVTRKMFEKVRCDTIVEIGCGTGKNTSLFCDIAKRVYALDFSPPMIRKARQKLANRNVAFLVADAEKVWPLQSAIADVVACNLILEHIADLSGVFSQASRTTRPSGRLFVSELHPFRQYMGVVATYDVRGKRTMINAFVHHVSDFLRSARDAHMHLLELNEWWHEADDTTKAPRLISFLFEKSV